MKRIVFLCFSLLFVHAIAFAQNVVFLAEASATTIGLEDQVQVSFTIQNVQDLQDIQNPRFLGFKVLAGPYQSQGTNYSFNGNQQVRTTTISLTYVLQANNVGTLNIPPILAKDAAGRTYQTNALSIKVVKGSLAQQQRQQQTNDPFAGFDPFDDPFFGGNGGGGDPFAAMRQQQARMQQLMQQLQQQAQSGNMGMAQKLPEVSEKDLSKNIFIRVTVDKTQVKVGEQITATYKMYARLAMQAQLSKLPSLNGFWTQDFDLPQNQKPQVETYDGVQYQTFTLKKSALFPQQTGTLTLDAAEAKGVARIADRANPYGKDVQFKLSSPPVHIQVSALPLKDQPANFGAAVGSFTMTSKIDKTNLTTDETANLTLNIAGSGNLKLIQAPILQLPNGLDAFDPSIVDTITGRSTIISGNKIITYSIAPRIPGDYQIPAIPFSFYNSKTNSYTTLYTSPFKLHVTKGKNDKNEIAQHKLLNDIHSIDTKTLKPYAASSPMLFSWLYWLLYWVPLLSLILFLLWKRKNDSEAGNIGLFKNKYANKIALKRLKTAKSFLDVRQTNLFYEEISKAIWLYLSDKLNIPLAQLSKETATEALQHRNISQALMDKINAIIDDCEMSLYAPSGAAHQMNSTYTETVQLIGQLEDTLKK
ncbi:MAG: BatD family protein [Phycisphaerales bacterium]|nr:BatD family protein [Phycisphaerales bacterium]